MDILASAAFWYIAIGVPVLICKHALDRIWIKLGLLD